MRIYFALPASGDYEQDLWFIFSQEEKKFLKTNAQFRQGWFYSKW